MKSKLKRLVTLTIGINNEVVRKIRTSKTKEQILCELINNNPSIFKYGVVASIQ